MSASAVEQSRAIEASKTQNVAEGKERQAKHVAELLTTYPPLIKNRTINVPQYLVEPKHQKELPTGLDLRRTGIEKVATALQLDLIDSEEHNANTIYDARASYTRFSRSLLCTEQLRTIDRKLSVLEQEVDWHERAKAYQRLKRR